jgi:hypothetical protein
MERTEKHLQPLYSINDEPIVLSKHLLDVLLKEANFASLLALYTFYYYTAKWQKTDQPKATLNYVCKGIGWSDTTVKKIKKQLKELGLIEDVVVKDNNIITGHFIKVNFIWIKDNIPTSESIPPMGSPSGGESTQVENTPPNALNPNRESISSLKKNKIVPKLFDRFWHIYPKKVGKGDALSAWLKICSRKEEPPTWEQVMNAVIEQIKTPQWQKKELIPNPATWLNGRKWLNDPEGMILYDREKESNTCSFNFIFGKDFDEYSGCVTCEEKHNKIFEQCRLHQR